MVLESWISTNHYSVIAALTRSTIQNFSPLSARLTVVAFCVRHFRSKSSVLSFQKFTVSVFQTFQAHFDCYSLTISTALLLHLVVNDVCLLFFVWTCNGSFNTSKNSLMFDLFFSVMELVEWQFCSLIFVVNCSHSFLVSWGCRFLWAK